jgi:hypothetical protein
MRLARATLLLLPMLVSGCVIPRFYDIPIVAEDPIWNDARRVTDVSRRSVTVDGVTTQIAGIDISHLSETEHEDFETSLTQMLRNKKVLVEPVSPGVSRFLVAGEPIHHRSPYMVCVPHIPLLIPRFVAARSEQIDVARQLLLDGSLALPATEEVTNVFPRPVRPATFFRPALPVRAGKKSKSNWDQIMRLDSQYELAAELASVGNQPIHTDRQE